MKLLPSGSISMTSSPGANSPLGDTRGLCVRSAFGERALPPKATIDVQPGMWSTFVHRWRRPILHAIAGGAIVGSGAVGITRGPSPFAVGDTSPSQVEVRQAPRFETLTDQAAQDSVTAGPTSIPPTSPAPTPDVVEGPATANAA